MPNILNVYEKGYSLISLNLSGKILSQKVVEEHITFFTVDDLLSQIDSDFEVNILIIWHPEYHFVPVGIEKTKIFTICCVGDWNVNFINLHGSIRRFDRIITDYRGLKSFSKYNFSNLSYFPIFSLRIPDYSNVRDTEKIYDILFIGNINQDVQTDRNKYLYRVAKLADKYNVLITGGIYGDEYKKLIAQSRIIFNRSIRGELNARVFEAMAAGSMMFLEEENEESGFYLNPGKEFIAYNSENLEVLLDNYLSHPQEIERAVKNSDKFFKSNDTEKFRIYFYKHVLELYKDRRIMPDFRDFNNFSEIEKIKVYYQEANFTLDKNILKQLEKEIGLPDISDQEIENLRAVSLYKLANNLNEIISLYEKSIQSFPKYIPLRVNYLNALLENSLSEKAINLINSSIEIIISNSLNVEDYKGLFSKFYTRFQSEYERVFAEVPESEILEKLQKLHLWYFYFELAKLKDAKNELEEAIKYFNLADEILSSSSIKNRLGKIYEKINDLNKAYSLYTQAFRDDLFNFDNLNDLISLEEKTNYSLSKPIEKEWMSVIDASPLYEFILNDKTNYPEENIKHKLAVIQKNINDHNIVNNQTDKILLINSNNYHALILKGKRFYSEKNFKKALEIFAKTLSVKKDNEIITLTVNCLKELGDLETMKKILESDNNYL